MQLQFATQQSPATHTQPSYSKSITVQSSTLTTCTAHGEAQQYLHGLPRMAVAPGLSYQIR